MIITAKHGWLRVLDGSGQFQQVTFRNGDFACQMARPKPTQTLVMDCGRIDEFSHYVSGDESVCFDPVGISFSINLNDATHMHEGRNTLIEALTCGDAFNPVLPGWTLPGISTKGSSTVNGKSTPIFEDDEYKTVDVEYVSMTDRMQMTYRFDECLFLPGEFSLAESDDGITLSVSGGCYGSITRSVAIS